MTRKKLSNTTNIWRGKSWGPWFQRGRQKKKKLADLLDRLGICPTEFAVGLRGADRETDRVNFIRDRMLRETLRLFPDGGHTKK